jgi:hypothetical protein
MNEPGSGNVDIPDANPASTEYYDPKEVAVSFATDSAGRSTQYSDTSIIASAGLAENPQQVMKDIVASPVASYLVAAQELKAVTPSRNLDMIQTDTTLTIAGELHPGSANEPAWSLNNMMHLVSTPGTIVEGRPIPKDDSFYAAAAAAEAYRLARKPRGRDIGGFSDRTLDRTVTPMTPGQPSGYAGTQKPYEIRGVQSLRLPVVSVDPAPTPTIGAYGIANGLVVARAAVNPTVTPTVAPTVTPAPAGPDQARRGVESPTIRPIPGQRTSQPVIL